MNFDLTDDQRMLVDTVATFVRKESPVSRFRALREDEAGIGWSKETFAKMGELGWLAVPFPESVGGMGGSMFDASLVLEQLGTALVPEPFLASVILGGLAVLRAGNDAQQARFLPTLIEGKTTLALAYAEEDSRYDLARVSTRAEKSAGGWKLRGEKRFVLGGHTADAFIVSARTGGGDGDGEAKKITLFAVPRDTTGVKVRTIKTMDGHRAAFVSFTDVQVGDDLRLGDEGSGLPVLESVIDAGAAAACAEGLGIMRTVLSMTRDYLNQREQFGVKIGTFQALQHRCVDMFVETELQKGVTILAAISEGDADLTVRRRNVSVAKAQLAVGGKFVTQQSIQLHGGIGITDEHDIGLYFKRMHVLNALFGDEEHHLARIASLG